MAVDSSSEIAVVIVNYNSGAFLRSCLESLVNQERSPTRTIVVDNGSSDRSQACVSDFGPKFKLLQKSRNLGFAAAANVGVRAADNCEWVACLNPDAFARPDWLAELAQGVDAETDCRMFASLLMMHGDLGRCDGAGDNYHLGGLPWRRFHGRCYDARRVRKTEVFSACAGAALYHRPTFLALGGFDEDFFCYLEDVDLGFRFRLAGYRCVFLPNAVVDHVGSATTGKGSDFQVYHGHRNLLWTYLKNMPGSLLLISLPLHLAINLAGICKYAFRGRLRLVLRAKIDGLRALPSVLRKRARIQRARSVSSAAIWKALDKRLLRSRFD